MRGAVSDKSSPSWENGKFLGGIPTRSVRDPLFGIAALVHLVAGTDELRKHLVRFRELRIDVGVPVQHADEVVEVVMVFQRDIFGHETPVYKASLYQRLKHRKHIAIHLRLVGDQRTGRV